MDTNNHKPAVVEFFHSCFGRLKGYLLFEDTEECLIKIDAPGLECLYKKFKPLWVPKRKILFPKSEPTVVEFCDPELGRLKGNIIFIDINYYYLIEIGPSLFWVPRVYILS